MTRISYVISGYHPFVVERIEPDEPDGATVKVEAGELTLFLTDEQATALSRGLAVATLEVN